MVPSVIKDTDTRDAKAIIFQFTPVGQIWLGTPTQAPLPSVFEKLQDVYSLRARNQNFRKNNLTET